MNKLFGFCLFLFLFFNESLGISSEIVKSVDLDDDGNLERVSLLQNNDKGDYVLQVGENSIKCSEPEKFAGKVMDLASLCRLIGIF